MHAPLAPEVQPRSAETVRGRVSRACGAGVGEPILSHAGKPVSAADGPRPRKNHPNEQRNSTQSGAIKTWFCAEDGPKPEALRPKPLTSRLSLTATEIAGLTENGWWARQNSNSSPSFASHRGSGTGISQPVRSVAGFGAASVSALFWLVVRALASGASSPAQRAYPVWRRPEGRSGSEWHAEQR